MFTFFVPLQEQWSKALWLANRAGQVRKLVRKSANPQLRTNEKSCGHADLRTLAV